MSQFFEKSFYPISFYYLGMFTKRDDQYMCLPKLNMKSIFVDYFNDINKIDVQTKPKKKGDENFSIPGPGKGYKTTQSLRGGMEKGTFIPGE